MAGASSFTSSGKHGAPPTQQEDTLPMKNLISALVLATSFAAFAQAPAADKAPAADAKAAPAAKSDKKAAKPAKAAAPAAKDAKAPAAKDAAAPAK